MKASVVGVVTLAFLLTIGAESQLREVGLLTQVLVISATTPFCILLCQESWGSEDHSKCQIHFHGAKVAAVRNGSNDCSKENNPRNANVLGKVKPKRNEHQKKRWGG